MDPYLKGDLRSCASFLSLLSWEPWLTFCPCIHLLSGALWWVALETNGRWNSRQEIIMWPSGWRCDVIEWLKGEGVLSDTMLREVIRLSWGKKWREVGAVVVLSWKYVKVSHAGRIQTHWTHPLAQLDFSNLKRAGPWSFLMFLWVLYVVTWLALGFAHVFCSRRCHTL